MPDSFRHQAVAAVPVDRAWQALQQPSVWEEVAGVHHITDPRFDDAGILRGYRFVVKAGPSTIHGTASTTAVEPPSHMRLDIDSSEVAGSITTLLEAVDSAQTLVTVEVAMRPKGLLAQMFYPIVVQAVKSGLPQQVETFATKLGA